MGYVTLTDGTIVQTIAYVVKSGDTPYSIASKLYPNMSPDTMTQAIADASGLYGPAAILTPGQTLQVPAVGNATPPTTASGFLSTLTQPAFSIGGLSINWAMIGLVALLGVGVYMSGGRRR